MALHARSQTLCQACESYTAHFDMNYLTQEMVFLEVDGVMGSLRYKKGDYRLSSSLFPLVVSSAWFFTTPPLFSLIYPDREPGTGDWERNTFWKCPVLSCPFCNSLGVVVMNSCLLFWLASCAGLEQVVQGEYKFSARVGKVWYLIPVRYQSCQW